MNPPMGAPASMARPAPPARAVPSFRSFVSVELPFALYPTNTTIVSDANTSALSAEEKNAIVAFLPPSFVVDCVQRPVPQRKMLDRTGILSANEEKDLPPARSSASGRKRNRGKSGGNSLEEVEDGNDSETGSSSESGSSSTSSSNSAEDENSGAEQEENDGANNKNASTASAVTEAEVSRALDSKRKARKQAVRLLTRHHRDYCAEPIFSDWRSTNWEAEADRHRPQAEEEERSPRDRDVFASERHRDDDDDERRGVLRGRGGRSDAADYALAQKRRRLDVFPSMEPQVLVNGYYRNDVLLQVRRRRRLRRLRDPATNAILREEWVDDVDGGDNEADAVATTSVLGVVSRELELARPADFTFSLFSPEQLHASPSLCGAEFFPPAHFLPAKAMFEVRYEPGKEANTSVTQHSAVVPPGFSVKTTGGGEETSGDGVAAAAVDASASQFGFGVLPVIAVDPQEMTTPPAQLREHKDFLRQLPSTLDGSSDDDPAEVRLIVRLLAERPAWVVRDLTDAMLQSGLCPRVYRNSQVMKCFTYVIRTGPFNRLRLRLGYDPYASSVSTPYQRIAVHLARRSDVGVRVRDVSRSPHIESVLRLLLERDRARRIAYKSQPGHRHCATLLELQCRAIREGTLMLPFQLIDAMDDPVVQHLVQSVAASDAPMPMERRGQRHGWLSDAAYTRAMSNFAESLAALLENDVEPLLRNFKGLPGEAEPKAQLRGDASTVADGDDDNEDDDDDASMLSSAMSSATAGDVSDDGSDDEE